MANEEFIKGKMNWCLDQAGKAENPKDTATYYQLYLNFKKELEQELETERRIELDDARAKRDALKDMKDVEKEISSVKVAEIQAKAQQRTALINQGGEMLNTGLRIAGSVGLMLIQMAFSMNNHMVHNPMANSVVNIVPTIKI